ncbi:helix-turn-helix domain-containing protein [Paenibacillus qinlingensis]|uniref:YesN/AraC family two-component response regulator n=1 Tax=Paenibacillus qinlingensis TaxID=1837343 RepID=A0ABU1NU23_9BACL|nr:helix-turn-helix domain-containing protein [Paenibacillus qinlingensis]MDR6550487.1 YesN/AraC family two-component response regulator [Paenibacillus qinlingensis]
MRMFSNGFRIFHDLKLVKKLWLSFSLVTLLALVIFALLSSTYIKRMMTDQEGNAMLQKIEYFTGSMDSYFQSIEKSSQLLVYNENVQEPLSANAASLNGMERILSYNYIYDQLRQLSARFIGIEAIYLVDKFQNVYDSGVGMNFTPSYLVSDEFTSQGWYDKMANNKSSNSLWSFIKWRDKQTSIVMFKTIYDKNNLQVLGYLIISISPTILNNYLASSNLDEGTNSIVDSNGYIFSAGSGESIPPIHTDQLTGMKGHYTNESDDYVVAYSKHPLTQWTFVHTIPQSLLLKDLKHINNLWVAFLGVSLILMVVVSVYISKTISMPLRKMIRMLRNVEHGNLNMKFQPLFKDELGDLGRAFNHMIDKVREGEPLMREKLVRSLLEGRMTETEASFFTERLNFQLDAASFRVVLLHLHSSYEKEELDQLESIMHEFEEGHEMISIYLSNEQYCLIFNGENDEALPNIHALISELKERQELQIYAFVGNHYEHFNLIKTSFEEAKALLNYLVGEQMDDQTNTYFVGDSWKSQYPEAFENKLLYYMDERDIDNCAAVMEELIVYARASHLVPHVLYAFMAALYNHLYKLLIKSGQSTVMDKNWFGDVQEKLLSQPLEKNGRQFITRLREHLGVNEQKEKKHSRNILKSLQIINEQYSDIGLGIDSVVEQVGLNANYFSQLFKKEVGVGFTDYVGQVRMEHAKRLLEDPANKIKDVALQIGFTNPHYFSIWFKENTGLSPSQFRKQLLGQIS